MAAQTKKMSKESEVRMIEALGEVAGLVTGGMPPSEAIAKAAAERNIPCGHIQIMANAYNTGRTELQRRSSDSVPEKAAEFALADADEILKIMYPETTKSAAVLKRESEVDPSYGRPPEFLEKRARQEFRSQAPSFAAVPVEPAPPLDYGRASKKALDERDRLRREVDDARLKAEILKRDLEASIDKLALDLRTSGAPNFQEVRENSILLFGKAASLLFDDLEERHSAFRKQAAPVDKISQVDHNKPPYSQVAGILKAAKEFLEAKRDFEKMSESVARREVELLSPFDAARSGVLGAAFSTKRSSFAGGLLGTLAGTTMGREIGSQIGGKDLDKLRASMTGRLGDPQHEQALNNIQTEAMLNDLMANDEVISTHDPNEILSHFNELSQLAPRASAQSGLARAILRKRLQQGALDPYEVDLLLKIENSLRMRDASTSAGAGVLNDRPQSILV